MSRSSLRCHYEAIGASLIVSVLSMTSIAVEADAATVTVAPRSTARRLSNPPVVFAQTQSDLAVDQGARFGRLANGMSYVIYKNKTPPGAASVWMRIGAGSVMEQEHQRGLAHFIEHMAFNGSSNVPEGDMVKLLQRDGLQFGADTNAETGAFETVYKLNLPEANDRIVGDALFLMRETAGNISFDPGAIDRERGVILGEERVRSTAGSRASEAELKQLLPGVAYPERLPIGKVEVIKTAQRPAFLQFYNDFYRPEFTTLIIAGDIDSDRIEAEIRRRFADWRPAPQSAAALTDFGHLAARPGPAVKVIAADGLRDTISITWAFPPVDSVETKAKDIDDLRFVVASAILNERYARAANTAGAAFAEAGLGRHDVESTARLYSLNIRPRDRQDQAAFDQASKILRDYIGNGPTQAELDRQLSQLDALFRGVAASAGTVHTQAIAAKIARALSSKGVLQSPRQELDEFIELRPGLTLAAIDSALKLLGSSSPTLLWRQGGQALPFDGTAMLAAYRTALTQPVGTLAKRTSVAWPYTQFGAASAVVSREALPSVSATRVTFANGVHLIVKQTSFEQNIVHVAVQLGNGKLGLRPDQGASLFLAAQVARPQVGGLGKLSSDDLNEALAGKIYGLDLTIGNNATILSGGTTKADLAVQMQLLTAVATDPGIRLDAFDRVRAALPAAYDERRTSPDGVYALKASSALYGDDSRFGTPSLTDALAVGVGQITALVKDQLGHGPVDITMVGDITPDEAIRQVGATFGALRPLAAAVAVSGTGEVRFPATGLHRVYMHDGRADQNLSIIAWPTTDYYSDPRRAVACEVLAAVMTIRELDEVREKQGATYSASAQSTMSRYFPDFGFIISRATVRPEVDDAYYQTVSALADNLKRHPVTADELTRARLPLIDRLRNEKNSNGYWLALLSGTVRDPRQIASAEARERNLQSITPDDLQQLAQNYLNMPKALRIQIKPKADIVANSTRPAVVSDELIAPIR